MKTNWFAIVFVTLTDLSSRLRQKLWGWVYNKIATRDTSGKFVFMNYGYAEDKMKHTLLLKPQDEPFPYFIHLYDFVSLLNKVSRNLYRQLYCNIFENSIWNIHWICKEGSEKSNRG